MCGNFDSVTVNDMTTSSNMEVNNAQTFGDSWALGQACVSFSCTDFYPIFPLSAVGFYLGLSALSLLPVAPVIYVVMSLESTVIFKSNQTLDCLLSLCVCVCVLV